MLGIPYSQIVFSFSSYVYRAYFALAGIAYPVIFYRRYYARMQAHAYCCRALDRWRQRIIEEWRGPYLDNGQWRLDA